MPSLSHELLRAHSISWCNVGPVSADGGVSMMTIEDCREFYAREVKFAASATTPGLVEAFAKVPREKFLGPGPWQIGSAEGRAMSAAGIAQLSYVTVDDPRDVYHNVLISLDRAKDINNGQPGSLACWIDALRLKPGERVSPGMWRWILHCDYGGSGGAKRKCYRAGAAAGLGSASQRKLGGLRKRVGRSRGRRSV